MPSSSWRLCVMCSPCSQAWQTLHSCLCLVTGGWWQCQCNYQWLSLIGHLAFRRHCGIAWLVAPPCVRCGIHLKLCNVSCCKPIHCLHNEDILGLFTTSWSYCDGKSCNIRRNHRMQHTLRHLWLFYSLESWLILHCNTAIWLAKSHTAVNAMIYCTLMWFTAL